MTLNRLVALAIPAILTQAPAPSLANQLQNGTQLVYSSDGTETPWTIDSVEFDVALLATPAVVALRDSVGAQSFVCVRLQLRTSPTAAPERRRWCASSSRVYAWDDRAGHLRVIRPLNAATSLDFPQRAGGSVRYETGAPVTETIGSVAVQVLPTTVTTRDSTGKIVRRLRERFAIGLATATGGVFEVPDSTHAGGWRTIRSFELVAIRRP